MTLKVALVGETAAGGGLALAAQLALAGHDARYALLSGQSAPVDAEMVCRGVRLALAAEASAAAREYLVPVAWFEDVQAACRGADIVILTCSADGVERSIAELAPLLARGQVVHINSYSCWCAMRAWPVLARHGRQDVTLCEATAPLAAYEWSEGRAKLVQRRGKLKFAAFPAERAEIAFRLVDRYCPDFRRAVNVVETSLSNPNLMMHPAISLLNVGRFDILEQSQHPIPFYESGMTLHVERLALAQDAERLALCRAFGVASDDVLTVLRLMYDAPGTGLRQAVEQCGFYKQLPALNASVWRDWMEADIRFAHSGVLALARVAALPTPIHDSLDLLFRVLLPGLEYRCADELELFTSFTSIENIRRYVTQG